MVTLGSGTFDEAEEGGIAAEVRKNLPWTKKYEAHKLDDLILPTEIHDEIEFALENYSLTD